MDSIRQGKPSASGAERWINCPASFLPSLEIQQESSPEADEGTMLHKVCEQILKGEVVDVELTAEQMKAVDFATKKAIELNNEELNYNLMLETRLWNKTKTFSGQADVVWLYDNRAIIIDYKFGRGDVAKATGNWQLATLAVLVKENFESIEEVDCYIIQPRATGEKVSSTRYTKEHLQYAKSRIENAIGRIQFENVGKCGDWCKYCPLINECAEAHKEIDVFKSCEITKENALDIFKKIKVVRSILDAMEGKIKEFASVEDIAGLVWVDGAKRAKFKDAQETFAYFSQIISAEKFLSCVEVSKGKLQKLYVDTMKAMQPELTIVSIEQDFNSKIQPLIEYKQNSPTLKIAE
jgi:hypothetical protein